MSFVFSAGRAVVVCVLSLGSACARSGYETDARLEIDSLVDAGDVRPGGDGAGYSRCPPPPWTQCVDVDGDGYHASAGCPEGDDFDDFDFLAHPGAVELPGDGVDNDNIGGDLAIDENSGIFVDSELGDDANAGTRAEPVKTLVVADSLRAAAGVPWIFLAARSSVYRSTDPTVPITGDVLGGLDPASWERGDPQTRSSIEHDVFHSGVLDTVTLLVDAHCGRPTTIVIRSETRTLHQTGPAPWGPVVIFRSTVVGTLDDFSGGLRVVESDVGTIELIFDSADVHRTIVRNRVDLSGDVRFSATSSIFLQSAGGPAIYAHDTESKRKANISLVHCALIGGNEPVLQSSIIIPEVTLGANAITSTGFTGLIYGDQTGTWRLVGNRFDAAGQSTVFQRVGTNPTTLDDKELNACNWDGCLIASDNALVTDLGFSSLAHLSSSSPLRDAAVDTKTLGASLAVAVDIDGDCRYADGHPDVGADEVP